MARKIMKFLIFLDDLAEVLLVHVLFSRRNWKKTTVALLAATALVVGSVAVAPRKTKARKPVDWTVKAERALSRGQVTKAIGLYEKAVATAPTGLNLRSLGLAYLEVQDHAKALQALQRSFALTPSRTTLFYMGCAYQGLKLHDVALGVFTQVQADSLKEQRMMEDAVLYRPIAEAKIGECYTQKGEYARAIAQLERTVARYPWAAHGHFYLGIARWDAGSPDRGVEHFFRVIELSPKESSAYYNVACYYSIKGAPDLALHWLDRALKVGFDQYKHMETDHDLDNIRDLPAYKSLLAAAKRLRPGDR